MSSSYGEELETGPAARSGTAPVPHPTECVQQVERLQAHRHTIRQTGAQLPGLRLPRRRARMVDLMSSDPSVSCDGLRHQSAMERELGDTP